MNDKLSKKERKEKRRERRERKEKRRQERSQGSTEDKSAKKKKKGLPPLPPSCYHQDDKGYIGRTEDLPSFTVSSPASAVPVEVDINTTADTVNSLSLSESPNPEEEENSTFEPVDDFWGDQHEISPLRQRTVTHIDETIDPPEEHPDYAQQSHSNSDLDLHTEQRFLDTEDKAACDNNREYSGEYQRETDMEGDSPAAEPQAQQPAQIDDTDREPVPEVEREPPILFKDGLDVSRPVTNTIKDVLDVSRLVTNTIKDDLEVSRPLTNTISYGVTVDIVLSDISHVSLSITDPVGNSDHRVGALPIHSLTSINSCCSSRSNSLSRPSSLLSASSNSSLNSLHDSLAFSDSNNNIHKDKSSVSVANTNDLIITPVSAVSIGIIGNIELIEADNQTSEQVEKEHFLNTENSPEKIGNEPSNTLMNEQQEQSVNFSGGGRRFLSQECIENTTGDAARNVATDDAVRNVATGDAARNVATGDAARNVATGAARNVATGDAARNVATGDAARNVATGDAARNTRQDLARNIEEFLRRTSSEEKQKRLGCFDKPVESEADTTTEGGNRKSPSHELSKEKNQGTFQKHVSGQQNSYNDEKRKPSNVFLNAIGSGVVEKDTDKPQTFSKDVPDANFTKVPQISNLNHERREHGIPDDSTWKSPLKQRKELEEEHGNFIGNNVKINTRNDERLGDQDPCRREEHDPRFIGVYAGSPNIRQPIPRYPSNIHPTYRPQFEPFGVNSGASSLVRFQESTPRCQANNVPNLKCEVPFRPAFRPPVPHYYGTGRGSVPPGFHNPGGFTTDPPRQMLYRVIGPPNNPYQGPSRPCRQYGPTANVGYDHIAYSGRGSIFTPHPQNNAVRNTNIRPIQPILVNYDSSGRPMGPWLSPTPVMTAPYQPGPPWQRMQIKNEDRNNDKAANQTTHPVSQIINDQHRSKDNPDSSTSCESDSESTKTSNEKNNFITSRDAPKKPPRSNRSSADSLHSNDRINFDPNDGVINNPKEKVTETKFYIHPPEYYGRISGDITPDYQTDDKESSIECDTAQSNDRSPYPTTHDSSASSLCRSETSSSSMSFGSSYYMLYVVDPILRPSTPEDHLSSPEMSPTPEDDHNITQDTIERSDSTSSVSSFRTITPEQEYFDDNDRAFRLLRGLSHTSSTGSLEKFPSRSDSLESGPTLKGSKNSGHGESLMDIESGSSDDQFQGRPKPRASSQPVSPALIHPILSRACSLESLNSFLRRVPRAPSTFGSLSTLELGAPSLTNSSASMALPVDRPPSTDSPVIFTGADDNSRGSQDSVVVYRPVPRYNSDGQSNSPVPLPAILCFLAPARPHEPPIVFSDAIPEVSEFIGVLASLCDPLSLA